MRYTFRIFSPAASFTIQFIYENSISGNHAIKIITVTILRKKNNLLLLAGARYDKFFSGGGKLFNSP